MNGQREKAEDEGKRKGERGGFRRSQGSDWYSLSAVRIHATGNSRDCSNRSFRNRL